MSHRKMNIYLGMGKSGPYSLVNITNSMLEYDLWPVCNAKGVPFDKKINYIYKDMFNALISLDQFSFEISMIVDHKSKKIIAIGALQLCLKVDGKEDIVCCYSNSSNKDESTWIFYWFLPDNFCLDDKGSRAMSNEMIASFESSKKIWREFILTKIIDNALWWMSDIKMFPKNRQEQAKDMIKSLAKC